MKGVLVLIGGMAEEVRGVMIDPQTSLRIAEAQAEPVPIGTAVADQAAAAGQAAAAVRVEEAVPVVVAADGIAEEAVAALAEAVAAMKVADGEDNEDLFESKNL